MKTWRFELICAVAVSFLLASGRVQADAEPGAAPRAAEDLLLKVQAPQVFVREESFPWPKGLKAVTQIIYGNSDIGYFGSVRSRSENGALELKLIPPTYLKPILFRAEGVDKNGIRATVELGSRRYDNPIGSWHRDRIAVLGPTRFPFVLMDWTLQKKNTYGTAVVFPVVINRLGEIVWAYREPRAASTTRRHGEAFELLDDGEFLFMKREEETEVQIVDSWGDLKRDIDFLRAKIPYPSSHTVQYLKDTNEIVFLSYDCRKLEWYHEFVPLFDGIGGWLRLLQLPRRSYLGSKVIRMSLDTRVAREVWRTYDDFSPYEDRSLSITPFTDHDGYASDESSFRYLQRINDPASKLWYGWPDQRCNVDWTHENSVQYKPGVGYLVSIRNLNKIVMLDENGKLKWRMGEGPRPEEFVTQAGPATFSMQHSAILTPENHVLLFDNHVPYRGFRGAPYWNRVVELAPGVPGPIEPIWSINLPEAPSEVKGSVSVLPDGNYFAYSAGNPGLPSDIYEIDRKESKITGHIRVNIVTLQRSLEAKPFYGFGGDKLLRSAQQGSMNDPGANEILRFSY